MSIGHVLGQKITQLRKERNISQEKLAELSGLHKNYIGSIERAEKNPTISVIYKIAYALDISLSDLFKGI